jgi:hypothetical protein
MKRLCGPLALMLSVLATGMVFADPVTIDFNDLPPSALLTDQYSDRGATFSLVPSPTEPGSPLPPPDGPTVWSLGPVNQFGVNGNSIVVGPTTTGPFYDVQLDLSRPADYFAITSLDQERLSDLRIQVFTEGQLLPLSFTATLLGEINALPFVSGPVYRAELGQVGGSSQFDRVVFGGSEQFDNLQINLIFTPESALADLLQEVTGIGPGQSLAAKIAAAQAFYAALDIQATCAMLLAFENEVGAQAGKKLEQAAATELIADERAIAAAIGCT